MCFQVNASSNCHHFWAEDEETKAQGRSYTPSARFQYLDVRTKLTGLSFLSVCRRTQLSHWQVPGDWMEGAYCSDMGSEVPVCHPGDLRKTMELLFPYFVNYNLCWESFSRDAVTKYHKFGGWKQQKWIFSQCWKGEVRGPCVGWADPFWMFWGTIPSPPLIQFLMDAVTHWPPWLVAADLQSSPPSPHDSLPVSVSRSKFPSSDDTSHFINTYPYLVWTHFSLMTSAKALFPNKFTVTSTGG